jgi:hypothetical protein
LQCIALTQQLATAFVARVPDLNDIGVRVLQMGRFEINFNEADRARLMAANAEIAKANRGVKVAQAAAQAKQFELDQRFGQDARYVKELAGNYSNYAAGQAVISAGQGMATHGVDGGVAGMGMQMAVGMNMAQAMTQGQGQQPQFPLQVGAGPVVPPAGVLTGVFVVCVGCGAKQAHGKFCAECGIALPQARKFCNGCGTELAQGAKFCANCGVSTAAPVPPAVGPVG